MQFNEKVVTELSFSDVEKIDEVYENPNSTSLHPQRGEVVVRCSEGALSPDIFTGVGTWCGAGCSPLPQNMQTFHLLEYPPSLISMQPTTPPILISDKEFITGLLVSTQPCS